MQTIVRRARAGLVGVLVALPVLLVWPRPAAAWWYGRGWGWAPPVVVVPPPPVVYGPRVVYAPPPRPPVWIRPHWNGPYWVPGHWG